MNRRALKKLDTELTQFLDEMVADMGRRERLEAIRAYVSGPLPPATMTKFARASSRPVHLGQPSVAWERTGRSMRRGSVPSTVEI
jgi:hypothetical protein